MSGRLLLAKSAIRPITSKKEENIMLMYVIYYHNYTAPSTAIINFGT